jgi:hypothetical protein
MDFRAVRGNGRVMQIVANKFDRADLRRQRRYVTPIFDVIVECDLFRSLDVSAGGVHLDGACEGIPVGTSVEGWIGVRGAPEVFAFWGEILRTDAATGNTVVRFDEIDPGAAEFLDSVVACRLH